MTLVYYKVNYLPVGVRIWFWVNCGGRVFGDTANFSSEIGYFLDPVFKANFFKFLEKYRVYKLPKKKC